MIGLATLYAPIASHLEASGRVFRDELISDQDFISDLCRHVEQYHGKQLRPALLLLTAEACGGVRTEHHALGAVVEMVHIATLVHDDVLDEADIRRRAATVNRLWGNERAVLLGDLLFAHAYRLCSGLGEQFAAQVVARTAIAVCEGEMMQVANRGNLELSEREYYDIINRKTASLIGACGLLGAHYAGAGERTACRLCEFGESLGTAFQITDDVLDLVGDEAEVGKSLGRDVEKGKLTLPVIHYLQHSSPAERREMLALLRENPEPASREAHLHTQRRVRALLAASDSIEYAFQAAGEHVAHARAVLAELQASDARNSLDTMAEFVLARRY